MLSRSLQTFIEKSLVCLLLLTAQRTSFASLAGKTRELAREREEESICRESAVRETPRSVIVELRHFAFKSPGHALEKERALV